jgi:hypothetical protein
MPKYLFLLLFTTTFFAQTKTITGVISDDANKPLESANVIAKPLTEKASIKFSIADNKGRYKIELDANAKYEITVSYIGYVEEVLLVEPNSTIATHDFKLVPTGEVLKEIVIKHEYKPIIIKKDTLVYDVKAFTNGNERKLKEQLEKLPGVEVDKNGGVTVQGKRVTKFLVEGDSFFGGGTKLGVENIPANAVEKVEVIDHFNEVGFMKQVSGSEDLAMNIKLKKDKKKFVFGDLEAAAEVGNDNGFYLLHASLFYYTPKTNVSFIGDANSIGKSTFTFQDLMRFDGGVSSFLSNRKSLTNLYAFADDNRDVVQNKSQFAALNFSIKTIPKLEVSGYSIFSKILTATREETQNTYLQNESIAFENRLQNGSTQNYLAIGNIKLDYSPNKKAKWYYNGQYQATTNDFNQTINSVTNTNANTFETISNADNAAVKQYIEWHKSYNVKHTTTFVINQAYEKQTPTTQWTTDQFFLAGLIPLQNDSTYKIQQIKKSQNNSVDALFKHYWIVNNFNHIYTNVGNNFGTSNFLTDEKQVLTDGSINNFNSAGFGNNIKYRLNDAYVGIEYKFKIGKWTNKPGIYLHQYNLKTEQQSTDFVVNKTLWQPQFTSDYEFNKSESLVFNYRLANTFPDANRLANNFTLQNYNLVFKGNALLENETFHAANLRYNKMNLYRGIYLFGTLSYNKKINTIRNEIQLDGINQFTSPILTDNPETNWRFNSSISKKIYRFNLKLNTNLSWFNYVQSVNNVVTENNRNNQEIGLVLKTQYKKWQDFSLGYTKGFNQFKGITNSTFQSDALFFDTEINFAKYFIFKLEYENLKNTDNFNQTTFFDVANTSLRYQKKNSPFGFELFANNVLNTTAKNAINYSDYLISNRQTFILPRVFMFSISYKL